MITKGLVCLGTLGHVLGMVMKNDWVKTDIDGVEDSTLNPILQATDNFEWILGDPTVCQLGEEIHMFANEVFHGIVHYTASTSSPLDFTQVGYAVHLPGSVRPYCYHAQNESMLYVFYEQYEFPLYHSSKIMVKTATVSDNDNDNKYDIVGMTWSKFWHPL